MSRSRCIRVCSAVAGLLMMYSIMASTVCSRRIKGAQAETKYIHAGTNTQIKPEDVGTVFPLNKLGKNKGACFVHLPKTDDLVYAYVTTTGTLFEGIQPLNSRQSDELIMRINENGCFRKTNELSSLDTIFGKMINGNKVYHNMHMDLGRVENELGFPILRGELFVGNPLVPPSSAKNIKAVDIPYMDPTERYASVISYNQHAYALLFEPTFGPGKRHKAYLSNPWARNPLTPIRDEDLHMFFSSYFEWSEIQYVGSLWDQVQCAEVVQQENIDSKLQTKGLCTWHSIYVAKRWMQGHNLSEMGCWPQIDVENFLLMMAKRTIRSRCRDHLAGVEHIGASIKIPPKIPHSRTPVDLTGYMQLLKDKKKSLENSLRLH